MYFLTSDSNLLHTVFQESSVGVSLPPDDPAPVLKEYPVPEVRAVQHPVQTIPLNG